MIGKLLTKMKEGIQDRRDAKQLKDDPLVISLLEHINDNWHGNPTLAATSDELKLEHFEGLFQSVKDIRGSDEPIVRLRQRICHYTEKYSENAVLVITEEEKRLMFFKDSSKISCELHKHLLDERAKELTGELEKLHFNFPDATLGAARDTCSFMMTLASFHMQAFDIIRIYLQDANTINPSKDWRAPYRIAMLELAEYQHRKKLGLQQLCGDLDPLNFQIFTKFVLTESEPLMEYEKYLNKLESEH